MVSNPRKTPSPGPVQSVKAQSLSSGQTPPRPVDLRSLNLPVPVEVAEDSQQRPVSITMPLPARRPNARSNRQAAARKGRTLKVASIDDLWQVDDEWWRERPISRRYYQVTTEDDRQLTVFRDQTNGSWHWQHG